MSTIFSPTDKSSTITLARGDLSATNNAGSYQDCLGRSLDQISAGDFYCEMVATAFNNGSEGLGVGIASSTAPTNNYLGGTAASIAYFLDTGHVYTNNGVSNTLASTSSPGTIIGIAINVTSRLVWFRLGTGNWNNSPSANPATNAGGISFSGIFGTLFFGYQVSESTDTVTAQFAASSWTNTPPAGYGEINPFATMTGTATGISSANAVASAQPKIVFLTTADINPWTAPSDWNPNNNKAETIGGAGGSGWASNSYPAGGGGGAYSAVANLALVPGSSVNFNVGAGGPGGTTFGFAPSGGDTWFNGSTLAGSSVGAKGGQGGNSSGGAGSGGAGGLASSGVGSTKFNGGNGAGLTGIGGGGGGAAGPNGAGNSGDNSGNGGSGDNGFGGAGGAVQSGSVAGNPGIAGSEWTSTAGAVAGAGGGGGGRSNIFTAVGTTGGAYGAGGGGGRTTGTASGAPGDAGIIVITYYPVTATSGTITATSTAAATSPLTTSGVIAGKATANAVGAATSAFAGVGGGSSRVVGFASSIAVTSGTIAGSSTAGASGSGIIGMAGTANGTSSVSASSVAIFKTSGTALGSSTAGASTALLQPTTGAADGVAIAEATGAAKAASAGNADGTSTASGIGQTGSDWGADGTSSAQAFSAILVFTTGVADGKSTATGGAIQLLPVDLTGPPYPPAWRDNGIGPRYPGTEQFDPIG